MSGEKLNTSSEDAAQTSAWDMLTKLNQENPDVPSKTPAGASEEFKDESKMYRKIGEDFIPQMTEAAKETTGVRDGQDLGEMLQEKASWERQIDKGVGDLKREIPFVDKALKEQGHNNGRDPITGAPTEDSPFKAAEAGVEEKVREGFLNWESDDVRDFAHDSLDALIYLAAGREAPEVNPDERTKKALEDSVTARFMEQMRGDDKKFEELRATPTYKVVERMVKIWQDNQEGKYEPIKENSVWDARVATKLYDEIDRRLSESDG
ncbi:hypothetical protein IJJ53_00970 [Candidatus Saccharibacteria bacterium]|nr:hypothetical protein [Candidatus Saccharibacteria bacterium]